MKRPVYLDYNATTPIDPAVVDAMLPYLYEHFGNPSSSHAYGQTAADAVEQARQQVADLIAAASDELIFTSCASESNNLAIKGVALANRQRGGHIITSVVEHPAVLNTCRYLAKEFGFALTVLPVDAAGQVDPDAVRKAIRPDTFLITIMHAQNETGVLQPVADIGRIAQEHGILFHVDAAQSIGKVVVDVNTLNCDLLTIAGHKLYAPKGVGALYIREGVTLHSLVHGASYEGGRRAGTANVPYVVGLGAACAQAAHHLAHGEGARLGALRDRLHLALAERLHTVLNGHETARLPNTLNISIDGVIGNDLLEAAPEVAASTGSACHAGVSEPSDVLLAMGASPERALGALRLTLARYTTEADVDLASEHLAAAASAVGAVVKFIA